jgi:hypothetical protein
MRTKGEWTKAQLETSVKALSIRQPWAELILRGLRNEHRTTRTKIRERVYIYACKALGAYLKEMAEINVEFGTHLDLKTLARGVLIGTVEIVDCIELGLADYEWVMNAPMRIEPCLQPTGFPQPSFFNPFPQPKERVCSLLH